MPWTKWNFLAWMSRAYWRLQAFRRQALFKICWGWISSGSTHHWHHWSDDFPVGKLRMTYCCARPLRRLPLSDCNAWKARKWLYLGGIHWRWCWWCWIHGSEQPLDPKVSAQVAEAAREERTVSWLKSLKSFWGRRKWQYQCWEIAGWTIFSVQLSCWCVHEWPSLWYFACVFLARGSLRVPKVTISPGKSRGPTLAASGRDTWVLGSERNERTQIGGSICAFENAVKIFTVFLVFNGFQEGNVSKPSRWGRSSERMASETCSREGGLCCWTCIHGLCDGAHLSWYQSIKASEVVWMEWLCWFGFWP